MIRSYFEWQLEALREWNLERLEDVDTAEEAQMVLDYIEEEYKRRGWIRGK